MFVSFGLWESPKIAKLNRVHLLWVVRSFVVRMARSDLRFHFMGAQITIGGIGIGCPADLGVKSKAHFKWTTGHATSINFWFVRGPPEFYHSVWFIFPLDIANLKHWNIHSTTHSFFCVRICIIDQISLVRNQVRGPTLSWRLYHPLLKLPGVLSSQSQELVRG